MKQHDYIKLAQAIKESTSMSQPGYIVRNAMIRRLCDILAADNPKFNKVKFLEACK